MNPKRKVCDLSPDSVVKLQQDWRAGLLPASSIARKHGVDLTDLRAVANSDGWEQGDLRQAIENEALRASVERAVSERDRQSGRTEPRVMNQAETVREYGQIVSLVTDAQKKDIAKARSYVSKLFQDLEEYVGPQVDREKVDGLAKLIAPDHPELAKTLREIPEQPNALREIGKKATVALQLINGMRELIAMERAAHGLDKPGGGSAGYDELLEELLQQRNGNGGNLLQ